MEDGRLPAPRVWSEAGWAWREREGIERPLYWTADGELRGFDRTAPLDPRLPVMHVSWFEADAYARWTRQAAAHRGRVGEGGRLGRGERPARRFPWGDARPSDRRANLDQLAFGPGAGRRVPRGRVSVRRAAACSATAGSGPRATSRGYPGFEAFPYREYSEIFFGGALPGAARRLLGNAA